LERRALTAAEDNYSMAELSVKRDNESMGVVIMPLPDN
jgi:hypothetical protein